MKTSTITREDIERLYQSGQQGITDFVENLVRDVNALEKRLAALEKKKSPKPMAIPKPSKPVLTYTALKIIAQNRYDEAVILLDSNHYQGAYYLAGYSVEMAFKARICKVLGEEDFFEQATFKDFKIHNLKDLLILSGLRRIFEDDKRRLPDLEDHWSLIQNVWSEQLRYEVIGNKSQQDTQALLNAISNPQKTGLLQWIQKHW